MNHSKSLSQDKILIVICRVEHGCLGPLGKDHVEEFCDYAKNKIISPELHFIHWEIFPRRDINLPEIQYKIGDKNLPYDKAAKYLNRFGKKIDKFEDDINEKLVFLIEQYLADK